jgi:hypothetical protein
MDESGSSARRPGPRTGGGLEIDEDLPFQRREWVAERVGWAAMALLVLAALLGLFGTGPLASATAGNPAGPLWIEYERFNRLLAPATLRVHLGAGAARGGEARVWLDRRYLESVQLQRVTPQPDGVEAAPDRMVFVFRMAEPDQPTTITFSFKPERFGSLPGRAGLAGAGAPPDRPLRFRQFVYP